MTTNAPLTPEDAARLDALTDDALAACRAEGVTDEGLIVAAATELLGHRLAERARAGDAQARRLERELAIAGMAAWVETEAAGRPILGAVDALARLFERTRREPRTQA